MWNLKGDISKKVNKDVDLVSLNSVGRVLQYEILWKGIRIYEVQISYNGREWDEGKKIKWTDAPIALWTLVKYRFVN